jgi:hypothetical protein
LHLVLSSEFHDAADPRLLRATSQIADQAASGQSIKIKGDGLSAPPKAQHVKVHAASTRAPSAWDAALHGDAADADADPAESSVSTIVESDEEAEDAADADMPRQAAVKQALSMDQQAHKSIRQQPSAMGSIGLSLALSSRADPRAHQTAAANGSQQPLEDLAHLARGQAVRAVEVESVLQGSPAHAAGIRKVRARPGLLFSRHCLPPPIL